MQTGLWFDNTKKRTRLEDQGVETDDIQGLLKNGTEFVYNRVLKSTLVHLTSICKRVVVSNHVPPPPYTHAHARTHTHTHRVHVYSSTLPTTNIITSNDMIHGTCTRSNDPTVLSVHRHKSLLQEATPYQYTYEYIYRQRIYATAGHTCFEQYGLSFVTSMANKQKRY